MSTNNIDVDMQHPEFQQEDVQTSHDTDLFGGDEDDEDDDKGPGDFMDVLSQPPTSVLQFDISQPPTSVPRLDINLGSVTFRKSTICRYAKKLKTTLRSNDVLQKKSMSATRATSMSDGKRL
ncbi:hypothetical protein EDB19DRAFT_1822173 [Suillus lakei]|nr:hypothetical protein EDB19DRAFT_1822173 [Suillus lakei]